MSEMKKMTRVRGSHVLILNFFFTVKIEISGLNQIEKFEVSFALCKRDKMSKPSLSDGLRSVRFPKKVQHKKCTSTNYEPLLSSALQYCRLVLFLSESNINIANVVFSYNFGRFLF